jgi:hypothetical protein
MPTFLTGQRKGTKTYALQLQTRCLPCFTELLNIWYPQGKKIVPENILDLLDAIALAHWVQGDGTWAKTGLVLCTESFSPQDVNRLLNVLIFKFKLDCTLQKSGASFNIYIRAKSMPLLRTLILQHIHSSMLYKLG